MKIIELVAAHERAKKTTEALKLAEEAFVEYRDNQYIKSPRKVLAAIREALAEPEKQEPVLAKHQPCGCIVCTCEDEVQCQGCGGWHCGTHPIGEFPNPLYAAPVFAKMQGDCTLAAVLAEREACAKVCDENKHFFGYQCAAAIRGLK